MNKLAYTLSREESGVTMIEYLLLAALISIVSVAVIIGIGTNGKAKFEVINNAVAGTATP